MNPNLIDTALRVLIRVLTSMPSRWFRKRKPQKRKRKR